MLKFSIKNININFLNKNFLNNLNFKKVIKDIKILPDERKELSSNAIKKNFLEF